MATQRDVQTVFLWSTNTQGIHRAAADSGSPGSLLRPTESYLRQTGTHTPRPECSQWTKMQARDAVYIQTLQDETQTCQRASRWLTNKPHKNTAGGSVETVTPRGSDCICSTRKAQRRDVREPQMTSVWGNVWGLSFISDWVHNNKIHCQN